MSQRQPHELRPFARGDLQPLLELYASAVRSQCPAFYCQQQVEAWAGHAQRDAGVATTLTQGLTLVNPVAPGSSALAAFAVLEPVDRLALLYCDGRWSRQGRSSALLAALEAQARQAGVQQLRTEASRLSQPLLLRRGWHIEAPETVLFAGEWFERWRMIKPLTPGHG